LAGWRKWERKSRSNTGIHQIRSPAGVRPEAHKGLKPDVADMPSLPERHEDRLQLSQDGNSFIVFWAKQNI